MIYNFIFNIHIVWGLKSKHFELLQKKNSFGQISCFVDAILEYCAASVWRVRFEEYLYPMSCLLIYALICSSQTQSQTQSSDADRVCLSWLFYQGFTSPVQLLCLNKTSVSSTGTAPVGVYANFSRVLPRCIWNITVFTSLNIHKDTHTHSGRLSIRTHLYWTKKRGILATWNKETTKYQGGDQHTVLKYADQAKQCRTCRLLVAIFAIFIYIFVLYTVIGFKCYAWSEYV